MFVLSKNSAKQQLTSSLAAALLLSGVSANVTSAQMLSASPEVESSIQTVPTNAVASSATASEPPEVDANSAAIAPAEPPTGTLNNAQEELAPSFSSDILVHAHEIDGRSAATLYVKDIPLLTFIGTEIDSLSSGEGAVSLALAGSAPVLEEDADSVQNPVIRASELGAELDAGTIEASEISVRWQEETDGYIVTTADADLIALDSRTVLPDTTEDLAEDALQVTNRLRRLLGDAEPISEIEGLPEPEPEPEPAAVAEPQQVAIISSNVGSASWYGPGFHGRLSANGEVFDQYALTAAHRTLPFGTYVRVTNLYNGAAVTVRINDRGPYAGDRIIDLSAAAADAIGITSSGVGTVQIDVLGY